MKHAEYISRRVMDTYMDRAIIKHQRLSNRIRAMGLVINGLTLRMKIIESSHCPHYTDRCPECQEILHDELNSDDPTA